MSSLKYKKMAVKVSAVLCVLLIVAGFTLLKFAAPMVPTYIELLSMKSALIIHFSATKIQCHVLESMMANQRNVSVEVGPKDSNAGAGPNTGYKGDQSSYNEGIQSNSSDLNSAITRVETTDSPKNPSDLEQNSGSASGSGYGMGAGEDQFTFVSPSGNNGSHASPPNAMHELMKMCHASKNKSSTTPNVDDAPVIDLGDLDKVPVQVREAIMRYPVMREKLDEMEKGMPLVVTAFVLIVLGFTLLKVVGAVYMCRVKPLIKAEKREKQFESILTKSKM